MALSDRAKDVEKTLAEIWDDLGRDAEHRDEFLRGMREELEAVFSSAIERAEKDRADGAAKREGLVAEIGRLCDRMSIAHAVPEQGTQSILAHTAKVERRMEDVRRLHEERTETLASLHGEMATLCEELGEDVDDDFVEVGESITMSRINAFKTRINKLQSEKESRIAAVDALADEAKAIWAELGQSPTSEYDHVVSGGAASVGVKRPDMDRLEEFLGALRKEKADRESLITELGAEITELWRKLATPEHEQTTFLESHNGIGDDVIATVKSYLEEKRGEFQARLGDLIAAKREEIVVVWTEIRVPEEGRRQELPEFFLDLADTDAVTEACYEKHCAFMEALEARAEEIRPLLAAVAKRDALLEEKKEYEQIISDPKRLLSRGGGAARLREERLERRVKRELPRVSARLHEAVLAWEKAHDKEFILDGARIVDVLEKEIEASHGRRGRTSVVRQSIMGAAGGGAAGKKGGRARSAQPRGGPKAADPPRAPSNPAKRPLSKSGHLNKVAAPPPPAGGKAAARGGARATAPTRGRSGVTGLQRPTAGKAARGGRTGRTARGKAKAAERENKAEEPAAAAAVAGQEEEEEEEFAEPIPGEEVAVATESIAAAAEIAANLEE